MRPAIPDLLLDQVRDIIKDGKASSKCTAMMFVRSETQMTLKEASVLVDSL